MIRRIESRLSTQTTTQTEAIRSVCLSHVACCIVESDFDARQNSWKSGNRRHIGALRNLPVGHANSNSSSGCRRYDPGLLSELRARACCNIASLRVTFVTARDARVNGSKRCGCRGQRYEEGYTARDNCSDQCHASGLYVWAEGKLDCFLWSHLIGARCGNAFGLG